MNTGGNAGGSAAGTDGTTASRRATALRDDGAGRAALRNRSGARPSRAGTGMEPAPQMASPGARRLALELLGGAAPLIDVKEAARTLGLSTKRTREWCRAAGVLRLEQGHYIRFSRVSFLAAIADRLQS